MGLAVGQDRIGHLAVGARADLAVFDVDSRTVPDALAELVEDGAGRAVATVIRGVVRADGRPDRRVDVPRGGKMVA